MFDPNNFEIVRPVIIAGSVAMLARLVVIGATYAWIVVDRLP